MTSLARLRADVLQSAAALKKMRSGASGLGLESQLYLSSASTTLERLVAHLDSVQQLITNEREARAELTRRFEQQLQHERSMRIAAESQLGGFQSSELVSETSLTNKQSATFKQSPPTSPARDSRSNSKMREVRREEARSLLSRIHEVAYRCPTERSTVAISPCLEEHAAELNVDVSEVVTRARAVRDAMNSGQTQMLRSLHRCILILEGARQQCLLHKQRGISNWCRSTQIATNNAQEQTQVENNAQVQHKIQQESLKHLIAAEFAEQAFNEHLDLTSMQMQQIGLTALSQHVQRICRVTCRRLLSIWKVHCSTAAELVGMQDLQYQIAQKLSFEWETGARQLFWWVKHARFCRMLQVQQLVAQWVLTAAIDHSRGGSPAEDTKEIETSSIKATVEGLSVFWEGPSVDMKVPSVVVQRLRPLLSPSPSLSPSLPPSIVMESPSTEVKEQQILSAQCAVEVRVSATDIDVERSSFDVESKQKAKEAATNTKQDEMPSVGPEERAVNEDCAAANEAEEPNSKLVGVTDSKEVAEEVEPVRLTAEKQADTMHTWSLSEALGMGRYEASQGYTSREVAKAVGWVYDHDVEGGFFLH